MDFDHENNGWGNGDQDPPGNSGPHNNAENGPGDPPPGIINRDNTATATAATEDIEQQAPESQVTAPAPTVVARRLR